MNQLFLLLFAFLLSIFVNGQSFEQDAKTIANRIDSISSAGRNELKLEIQKVDEKLEKGEISAAEAKTQRENLADLYANKIESQVDIERAKLDQLINQRVDNQIYTSENDSIDDHSINIKFKKDKNHTEKRTTSQFVFAFGINTLNSDEGSPFKDELKLWNSRFWEYGVTANTRISKESNLLRIKYGASLVYNNLKPEDNQIFVADEDLTGLAPTDIDFKRYRFRNFYVNLPVHLEFDFSEPRINDEGEKIFVSHEGFRVGLGGYVGILVNSKEFYKYEMDGAKVKGSVKDDYNVNNFNYGLSSYVGYGQFSLYSKYDLQPLFEDNPIEDRNLSFGLRWDFN